MNNKYIIPFLNDINNLKEIFNNFNNIKNKFNESLDEFQKYQIEKIPSHFSTLLLNHFYIISNDWDDLYLKLKLQLNQIEDNDENETNNNSKQPCIIYIFSGQGTYFNEQVWEFYENEIEFKNSMDEIDKIMKDKYLGYSVLENLKSINNENELNNDLMINQISLLMIQISFLKLLKNKNINPSIIIGISFGEVVASFASGMISDLETLCYLIYMRCKLQKEKTYNIGKRLMWINISKNEFKELFSLKYPNIEIASILSKTAIVVGGDINELEELELILKSKSIFAMIIKFLPTAFHTSCQEILKDDILKLKFQSNPPILPHISTVDGSLFNDSYYFNSQYMYENIRQTTRFDLGIETIYKYIENNNSKNNNNIIFIEISSKPTILNYIKEQIPNKYNYCNTISFLCPIQIEKGLESFNDMVNNIKSKGYKIK